VDQADSLLVGALDIHAHGYPEISLEMGCRVDNLGWAELASAAKMRGFVIKSHIFPTTTAAQMLRAIHPELEVFGSITLNPPAGGLSPVSVELAARAGARIVWMPTWSARTPVAGSRGLFLRRMQESIAAVDDAYLQEGCQLGIRDPDGGIAPDVAQILQICKRYELTIASGHLPVDESLLLAREAQRANVRFIFTHPLNGSVSASIENQLAMAEAGAFIEHTFVACMPLHHRLNPASIVESIEAVGAERSIMSSDAIEAWNPPAPELMRMFIASMLALGVKKEAVYLMTHDNPALAIGLESGRSDSTA
jgi:hypothetical protein